MNTSFIEKDIREIPKGVNAKLILRHSLRPSLKNIEDPDNVSLTNEGLKIAYDFGAKLDYPIGELISSKVLRCRQTIEQIQQGSRVKHTKTIDLVDMKMFYTYDSILSDITFKEEKNGKSIISKLLSNEALPGFYTLDKCVSNFLDYIFAIGNIKNSLDIICTHDFQIMYFVSWLFKYSSDIEFIKNQWPRIMEGVVLWGVRNDFYCIWRSNIKHFVDSREIVRI